MYIRYNATAGLKLGTTEVPFHYSLESHDYELQTYMKYKDLLQSYERALGTTISASLNRELITIFEKRLPAFYLITELLKLRRIIRTIHGIPPSIAS